MIVSGYDHGERGAGIRDLILVLPSVGCANSVVEMARRQVDGVRVLTHQHGCGQLGADLDVTRELLARTSAHPNLRGAIVVSLGCETNRPDELARRARELGAAVRVVGIQELGGASAAVEALRRAAAELRDGEVVRRELARGELRLGLICDRQAGERGEQLLQLLMGELAAEGIATVDGGPVALSPAFPAVPTSGVSSIPELWLAQRSRAPSTRLWPTASASEIEALSLVAAAGAHVIVLVTGRLTTVGSPIAPTLRVCVDPDLGFPDLYDIVAAPGEAPRALAERVIHAVAMTAAGQPTEAERSGQRDFAILRSAPSV